MPVDHERLCDFLSETNPDALFLGVDTEFDPALLGTAERDGNHVAVYSREGIITCLIGAGMEPDDAEEWCAFNLDVLSLPVNMPKKERPRSLTCAGCGQPVIPNLGPQKVRHFSHDPNNRTFSCSWESYLHQAGKRALAEAVEDLIRTGKSLTLIHPHGIRNLTYRWDGDFVTETTEPSSRTLDVGGATVTVEKGEKGFVADVLMRASELNLLLEVAVTHRCSTEKVSSGVPILEFDLSSEEDIERMVGEVRSGEVIIGGVGAQVRAMNLDLETVEERFEEADWDQVLTRADEILCDLYRPGTPVRLRDGSRSVVPRIRAGAYGSFCDPVEVCYLRDLLDMFEEALRSGYPGLFAILPDEVDEAAYLLLRHLSGKEVWTPEMVRANPFDLMGRLDPSIPEEVRDRIISDGTLARWRDQFGIFERNFPERAPRKSAPGVSIRDLTVSLSRDGRLCATRDARVFGAMFGTFQVASSKPDIWLLDQVMRGRLGRVRFVRSCLNCRNHGFSSGKEPIFCFRKKSPCHQTDAIGCKQWSWIKEDSELVAHRKRIAENPKAPAFSKIMI